MSENQPFNRVVLWIGIIGSLASIVGLGWIYWENRLPERELSVTLISKNLLLSDPLEDDFDLIYKDKPVNNVVTFIVEMSNTGRQPIRSDDFEGVIELQAQGVNSVVSVEEVKSIPADVSLSTRMTKYTILIDPLLLNSKDMIQFSITALCKDSCGEESEIDLNLSARIAGISNIELSETSIQNRSPLNSAPLPLWVVMVYVIFVNLYVMVIAFGLAIKGVKFNAELSQKAKEKGLIDEDLY